MVLIAGQSPFVSSYLAQRSPVNLGQLNPIPETELGSADSGVTHPSACGAFRWEWPCQRKRSQSRSQLWKEWFWRLNWVLIFLFLLVNLQIDVYGIQREQDNESYKSVDGMKFSQSLPSLTTTYQHTESKNKKNKNKSISSQILFIVTFTDGAMLRTNQSRWYTLCMAMLMPVQHHIKHSGQL